MDRELLLDSSKDLDDEEGSYGKALPNNSRYSIDYMLRFLLALSLASNLLWFTSLSMKGTQPQDQPLSLFAGLARDRSEPYVLETLYSSPNETLQAEMWHSISIDAGMVALPDSWVSSHQLRAAQRFPWDPSKGLYLLHGYHNLHCVKVVYTSLREYRASAAQTRNWRHVVHCLDALRRQVLCDADDTPRATDRRVEVVSGVGQHRFCRRWEELEEFARRHTACYRRPERPEDGAPIIDRFKHCPEGSGYVVDDNYVPVDELLVGLPEESRLHGHRNG